MKFLSDLTTNSRAWQLLAVIAIALECSALFFQYGLDLAPCIMCIYQRVAIWSIFIAGVIGSVGCQFVLARIVAYILWATGGIWGLFIALEHIDMQEAAGSPMSFLYSCDFIPNFPSWAPLHEWIPFLFEASGDCGEISWQFLGYSMPQWMLVIYACFSIAFIAVFLARLIDKKMF
ncbi:disulfide bond formation protein DsbB [Thalassotalea sp. PLHSN55]|uniref:disulfide bond formation protein DsbB n=1 Tax=Thalassotalea sp. PLHSN55 TaxID=3435888 RepID=UPI003F87D51B